VNSQGWWRLGAADREAPGSGGGFGAGFCLRRLLSQICYIIPRAKSQITRTVTSGLYSGRGLLWRTEFAAIAGDFFVVSLAPPDLKLAPLFGKPKTLAGNVVTLPGDFPVPEERSVSDPANSSKPAM
jgi:hypothetical protein